MKLLVDERDSELVAALWDGCDIALASRLADVEVCAAVAASHRHHDLDDDTYVAVLDTWHSYWDAVRPVELIADVAAHAGKLAASRSLRGADAVHLASAMVLDVDDVVVAVWDRRLHAAAVAEGLMVAPRHLS